MSVALATGAVEDEEAFLHSHTGIHACLIGIVEALGNVIVGFYRNTLCVQCFGGLGEHLRECIHQFGRALTHGIAGRYNTFDRAVGELVEHEGFQKVEACLLGHLVDIPRVGVTVAPEVGTHTLPIGIKVLIRTCRRSCPREDPCRFVDGRTTIVGVIIDTDGAECIGIFWLLAGLLMEVLSGVACPEAECTRFRVDEADVTIGQIETRFDVLQIVGLQTVNFTCLHECEYTGGSGEFCLTGYAGKEVGFAGTGSLQHILAAYLELTHLTGGIAKVHYIVVNLSLTTDGTYCEHGNKSQKRVDFSHLLIGFGLIVRFVY